MTTSVSHVVEVLCSLKFEPSKNDWDSTYFGKFHDKIIPLGYTEKEEQKEMTFEVNLKAGSLRHEKDSAIRFVFRNKTEKTAIIIGAHFISFHKLAPYTNWDDLINNILIPGLEKYQQLGLGNSLKQVQCTYINKMQLEEGQHAFDKFKILVPPPGAEESSITFQGNYEISPLVRASLKLNWNKAAKEPQKGLFFECTTFVKANGSTEYVKIAKDAHDHANVFYDHIKK